MSSSSGRPVYHDPRTGRSFYYEPRTSEFVYSDGSRVPASSQFAQPAPNVPRTSPGVVQQQSSNTFSNHPYNQQYTSLPPVTAGPSVQGVTQQFQNVNIAKSFAPNTSAIPYAAGRPIDGAEVVRNPPIRGAPPRRVSFLPEHRNGLLDPGFRVREHPRGYFVPGKVFLTLWTEPASEASGVTSNKDVFAVAFGERAFCRVRRFVVVRSGAQSCSALAVSTHSGRGSPKANKNEHGIIYTGRSPSDTGNERGMQPIAIKVNPDEHGASLDTRSRLNYGKLYNVEHNIKVKHFGSLSPDNLKALLGQFMDVFTSKMGMSAGPAPTDRDKRPDMTGKGPKDRQQFIDAGRREAVARHGRNSATGGRASGSNNQVTSSGRRKRLSTGAEESEEDEEDDANKRRQKPADEEESDDGDDDEDDGNAVKEESSEDDDEDANDEGDDTDDDDDTDDE